MNRQTLHFLSGALIILLAACTQEPTAPELLFPRKIIAMPEGERPAQTERTSAEAELNGAGQKPLIALQFGERLIKVLTANLDADEPVEQVIVVKDTRRENAPLKMYIADKAIVEERYRKVWETELTAVNEGTIRIDIKDIIGVQSLQIVASGMNSRGDVTLDIFKPLSPFGSLSYQSVFTLESEGSIEIIETDAGAGYSGGHRYGASFPIRAYRSNPESPFYSDIIRETYQYDYATARYQLVATEKIRKESAPDPQLAALFQSTSPEAFQTFIEGLWQRVAEEGADDEKILDVNPEGTQMTFFSTGIQEVYMVKYARRSLYNALNVYTENELLQSIQANITLTLVTADELEISITEYSTMEQWLNDQWGGRYRRLDQSQLLSRQQTTQAVSILRTPFFDGDYTTGDGTLLSFELPRVVWQNAEKIREGGYAVATITSGASKTLLLMIKFIENQGLDIEDRFFILETPPDYTAGTVVTTVILKPAQTGVYGVTELKADPIALTRKP